MALGRSYSSRRQLVTAFGNRTSARDTAEKEKVVLPAIPPPSDVNLQTPLSNTDRATRAELRVVQSRAFSESNSVTNIINKFNNLLYDNTILIIPTN